MAKFCGIDPGASGYIAIINDNSPVEFFPIPFDGKQIDTRSVLKILGEVLDGILMEEQLSIPGMNGGLVTRFTNYGMLLAALNLSGNPFQLIRPKKWKKQLDLSSNKEDSIKLAHKLYPKIDLYGITKTGRESKKESHDKAEALLLAHLCKLSITKSFF